MKIIQSTMTPAREAWLRKLAQGPQTKRPSGVVGYNCWHLKWSQWAYWINGEVLGQNECDRRYGLIKSDWPTHEPAGEILTDEGQWVLMRLNQQRGEPG